MEIRKASKSLILGSFAAFAAAVACGGSGDDGSTAGAGGTTNIDLVDTVNGSNSSTGAGGNVNPGTPTACTPGPDESGCVGASFEGESIPLDIYVMFDLSCSMSCTVDQSGCCRNSDNRAPERDWRIQPVREAMRTFLRDPQSAGIGVGLGFFGDHDVNDNTDPVVCSLESHTDAAVEIQPLPGAADALIAELDAGEPQGGTPTHLAIQGSCDYVERWKQRNPSHKVVILLVTDGIPEHSCQADIRRATDAARSCYDGGQGFETYVLGVVANNNNSLEQLHDIADAGGTDRAYLTDSSDVSGSVLAALNAIRADAVIPCDMQIPDPPNGEMLNPNRVNLGICNAAGEVVVTPYVGGESACAGSPGWYYDDPNSPEMIHLCDVTCDTVSVPGSTLYFNLGCVTQTDVH